MSDDQHRTRWTLEETNFLQAEWDGTRATTELIADCIGRTADAVQQHFYQLVWGTTTPGLSQKPLAGSFHVTSAAYRSTLVNYDAPTTSVCPSCFCYKSAAGKCNCDI